MLQVAKPGSFKGNLLPSAFWVRLMEDKDRDLDLSMKINSSQVLRMCCYLPVGRGVGCFLENTCSLSNASFIE